MTAAKELGDRRAPFHGGIIMKDGVLLTDLVSIGVHYRRVGVLHDGGASFFQKCGFPQIILIQEGQQFTTGVPRPLIASRRLAAVYDVPNAPNGILADQTRCVVCGGVIDHNDLNVAVALGQYALDGFREIATDSIVGRNDDRDMRHGPSA